MKSLPTATTFGTCLIFILFLNVVPRCYAQAMLAPEIGGEWRGGLIIGDLKKRDDGCQGFQWMDLRVSLMPIPGKPTEFRGVWTTEFTAAWISATGDKSQCRFNDEVVFSPTSTGVARQSLTGHFDARSNNLLLDVRMIECRGSACQAMFPDFPPGSNGVNPKPEERTVAVGAGTLSFRTDPQHSFVLKRSADVAEQFIPATKARDQLWQDMEHADVKSIKGMLAAENQVAPDKLVALTTVVGKIEEREPVASILTTSPDSKGPKDTVLLVSHIVGQDGRQGTEFCVLTMEDQQWRVLWLYLI